MHLLGRKLRGEEPYCPGKGGKVAVLIKAQSMQQKLRSMPQTRKISSSTPSRTTTRSRLPLADKYVGSPRTYRLWKGKGQALNQYYNSQQYKDLAGQARYQSLAAAEATGGLVPLQPVIQLSTIAPTLGQQWLSGQMNNYQNLANIGLGALQGQANAGQTYANNMSQISQQSAALCSGKCQQTISNAICYWRRCVWRYC